MKRGAERQLTKDGLDGDGDDDIEEIAEPQGFQKADDAALSKRQIRALPKRALAGPKPPLSNGLPSVPSADADDAEFVPPPRFGGFVGFGATTSTFAFTPQPPPLPALASSAFDAKSPLPFNPTPVTPLFGAPTLTLPDANISSPKPTASPEETHPVAFKYYKSLRGLNVSLVSAISNAVEKDPFCDVANLIESYKNLRTTIQSEFDGSSRHGSVTTCSPSPFDAKPPTEKITPVFSVPKPSGPPADSSPKLASISESGTKTGGLTFQPFVPPTPSAPTQLPFSLTSKPNETSSSTASYELPKSTFTFSKTSAPMSGTPPASGFSFATPPSVDNTALKSAPRSSSQEAEGSVGSSSRPDSTAPSFGSSSVPNFFTNTKPASAFGASDTAPRPTSVFGGSIFGGASEPSTQSFTSPPSDSKDSFKGTPTFFSSTTTPSSTSTSIFGSSDKPTSVFGSVPQPKTSTFAFGKLGGSIGNPVGFGFGAPSASAGDGATSALSGSGFNFGTPSMKPSESFFSPPPTDKSTESTPQPDAEGNEEGGEEDGSKLLPSHLHDQEGEGEEDEETVHVVKCKVFRLSKSDGKNEWKDLGVGMFRLKKHKTTNVRRALMRNSSTGRILINFRLYAGLKPSLAKTMISFIGYENGVPTSFRIRVKTEEQAGELRQAIDREVATVQAAA